MVCDGMVLQGCAHLGDVTRGADLKAPVLGADVRGREPHPLQMRVYFSAKKAILF